MAIDPNDPLAGQPLLTPADVGLPDVPEPITGPDEIVPISPTNPHLANPEPVLPAVEPAVAPVAPEPVAETVPAPIATAPEPTTAPVVKPGEKSAQYSATGFTRQGMKVARGYFNRAEKNAAGMSEDDAHRTNTEVASARRAYSDYAATFEKEQRLIAENEAEMEKLAAEKARLEAEHALEAQRISQDARTLSDQYLADHEEQLAGIAALTAQSGNPLPGADPALKLGLVGAAFAQGFLAPKIQIDVIGQINQWVDREIREHNNRIFQSRKDAADTESLYGIAKQASADEFEAYQKYKTFVMQSLQTQIDVQAKRFNSGLARIQADRQKAVIQGEMNTTLRAIHDGNFKRNQEMLEAERRAAKDEATLAIQRQELKLREKQIELQNRGKVPDLPLYAADKTEVKVDPKTGEVLSGGKVFARINPDAPNAKEAMQKIQSGEEMLLLLTDGIKELQQLRPKGPITSEWFNKRNPDYVRWSVARNKLAQKILNSDSGKAFTLPEWERAIEPFKSDKIWFAGSMEKVMFEATRSARQVVNARVRSYVGTALIPIQEGEQLDPRLTTEGYLNKVPSYDQTGRAGQVALDEGGAPIPGPIERIKTNVGTVGDDDAVGPLGTTFGEFVRQQGGSAGAVVVRDLTAPAIASSGGGAAHAPQKLEKPAWAQSLENLALASVNPKGYALAYNAGAFESGSPPETPIDVNNSESLNKLRGDALNAIRDIRGGGDEIPPSRRAYAKYLDQRLDRDAFGLMQEILNSD